MVEIVRNVLSVSLRSRPAVQFDVLVNQRVGSAARLGRPQIQLRMLGLDLVQHLAGCHRVAVPVKTDAGHELAHVLRLHDRFHPASQVVSLVVKDEQLQVLLAVAIVAEDRSESECDEIGHLSGRKAHAVERKERNEATICRFVGWTDSVDFNALVLVCVQKPSKR